jgi:hypothetical protein
MSATELIEKVKAPPAREREAFARLFRRLQKRSAAALRNLSNASDHCGAAGISESIHGGHGEHVGPRFTQGARHSFPTDATQAPRISRIGSGGATEATSYVEALARNKPQTNDQPTRQPLETRWSRGSIQRGGGCIDLSGLTPLKGASICRKREELDR